MKSAVAAVGFAIMAAVPFAAQAQFAKVDDAVDYRKSAMFIIGQHFGRIGAVVKGVRPYDKATVESDAAVIESMAKLPWHAFVPDSATPDSKAKAEVWKEADKFKTASEKMMAETVKLSAAAKTGDLAMVKTQFGNTAQTCKGCHDNFKSK